MDLLKQDQNNNDHLALLLSSKTTTCPICYESDLMCYAQRCGHYFCQTCLEHYCSTVGQNNNIVCPFQECNCPMTNESLRALLSDSEYSNYQTRLLSDESSSPKCPNCRRPLTCLWLQCSHCHSKRHLRHVDKKSLRYLRNTTKPCSRCGVAVYKSGGCDHIVCQHCLQDWCWKCGTHEYLHGDGVIRNCRNCKQSFVDHRKYWRYRLQICLAMPLLLPCVILHFIVMILYCIVTCGFCCCLCMKKKNQNSSMLSACRRGTAMVCWPVLAVVRDCGGRCFEAEIMEMMEGGSNNNNNNNSRGGVEGTGTQDDDEDIYESDDDDVDALDDDIDRHIDEELGNNNVINNNSNDNIGIANNNNDDNAINNSDDDNETGPEEDIATDNDNRTHEAGN